MKWIKPGLFIFALIISLLGVHWWGGYLKNRAYETWLEKAELETNQITNTSFYWISLFHTQLRGLAALFYGSQSITENEFFNGLELIEEIESESVIPLSNVVLLSVTDSSEADLLLDVVYSSDIDTEYVNSPMIQTVAELAMENPEEIVLGPIHRNAHGDHILPLAIQVPNEGAAGVLLSLVNLTDFFSDLAVLYFPDGVQLKVSQTISLPGSDLSERVDNLTFDSSDFGKRAVTFHYPTRSGNAQWDYYWDISTSYQGGINTALGNLIQLGGSVLIALVYLIISFFAYQNRQVNFLVRLRTQELAEATTALEKANKELEELASHDSLTNALNRRSFLEIADKTLATSERSSKHLSFIMIDVDYFKNINDRFGHAEGDSVLISLVAVFNQVLREGDYLGRIGGEEFAILLWDTGIDEATLVAERLRCAISTERFLVNNQKYDVTVSMGIAQLNHEKGDTISQIMKRADDALYYSKRQGRNRYAVYRDEMGK